VNATAEVNVTARNHLGQFIRAVELAGENTVKDMIEEGAKTSRRLAPVGHRHDRRSVPLRESIYTRMAGRTRGSWGASARHAMFVEHDTRPHLIPGNPTFGFYWESEHRDWIPGLFGEIDYVNHPGTQAQPFLQPALRKTLAKFRQIARRRYS